MRVRDLRIGQIFREHETNLHRAFKAEPQTAMIVDFLPRNRLRVRRISGCGKARTRVMLRTTLVRTHALVQP